MALKINHIFFSFISVDRFVLSSRLRPLYNPEINQFTLAINCGYQQADNNFTAK